jgi:RNA polymerase sigma-70 factor (ECF subfamily)
LSILRLGPEKSGIDPDDVIQEVKIKIWKKFEREKNISRQSSYIQRIVNSTLVDLIRTARRQESLVLHEKQKILFEEGRNLRRAAQAASLEEWVGEAADSLLESRRKIVKLFLMDLTLDEICSILNWSRDKTRNLLYRGLADLREKLKDKGLNMRIDLDGLKAAYRNSIRQTAPSSMKGCPSARKIVTLLRSGLSEKETTKVIDHVTRCKFCFSEFEFVLDVLRQERDFAREVERGLPGDHTPPRRKESRQNTLSWRLHGRTFVPRFSWRAATILAGFALAGLFLAKSGLFRPAEKFRSGSPAWFKLLEPVRERTPQPALVLRWEKVKNSEFYIVELFDQALSPVWKSDRITGESAALPGELTKTLDVDRSYFWTVTAYFANGEKISSALKDLPRRVIQIFYPVLSRHLG